MLFEILLLLAVALGLVNLVVSLVLIKRTSGRNAEGAGSFLQASESLRSSLEARIQGLERSQRDLQANLSSQMSVFYRETRSLSEKLEARQRENTEAISQSLEKIREENQKAMDRMTRTGAELTAAMRESMDKVRVETNAQLERIRGTVEDKLQETLETKLSSSFSQVTKNLDALYKSLGEMNKLAGDVSSLSRMFSNVKSRGTWGEVQAEAILSDLLTPSQYVRNYSPQKGCTVEFAVLLPGRQEGSEVYLPIDSKFPADSYVRYTEALDSGSQADAEEARKTLRQRVLKEARDIATKYIVPPKTTDFALLFVPTESLYAELLRMDGLSEELQARYRIVLTGPSNFAALLNSLQMGFKTLQVEKSTEQVLRLFKEVKEQFSKFSEDLRLSLGYIEKANTKVENALRRSAVISGKFDRIELPDKEKTKPEYAELTAGVE